MCETVTLFVCKNMILIFTSKKIIFVSPIGVSFFSYLSPFLYLVFNYLNNIYIRGVYIT